MTQVTLVMSSDQPIQLLAHIVGIGPRFSVDRMTGKRTREEELPCVLNCLRGRFWNHVISETDRAVPVDIGQRCSKEIRVSIQYLVLECPDVVSRSVAKERKRR